VSPLVTFKEAQAKFYNDQQEERFKTHVALNADVISKKMGKRGVAFFDGNDLPRMKRLLESYGYRVYSGDNGMYLDLT
jgi:hypothetical protein